MGNSPPLRWGHLRSLLLSTLLCSWAGDSRRQCLGGMWRTRRNPDPGAVVHWDEEGAEHLQVRTTVSSVGTDHASYCLPVLLTVGAASEGYGVYAKKVRGGDILPCTSNCHTTQYGNTRCGFVFETKAVI